MKNSCRYKPAAALSLPLLVATLLLVSRATDADPIVSCIDSPSYPIKVCYEDETDSTAAAQILGRAEQIWEILVLRLGFTEPWRFDGAGIPERGVEVAAVQEVGDRGGKGCGPIVQQD